MVKVPVPFTFMAAPLNVNAPEEASELAPNVKFAVFNWFILLLESTTIAESAVSVPAVMV